MTANILPLVVVFFFFLATSCFADVRHTKIRSKGQEPLYIDTFGFTKTGRVELNLRRISFSNPHHAGFFLIPASNVSIFFLEVGDTPCQLQYDAVVVIYNVEDSNKQSDSHVNLSISKPDSYNLFFQNCLPGHASMDVRSAMYNLDRHGKQKNYLSSRKQYLFGIYLLFTSIYLFIAAYWICQLHMEIPRIFFLFAVHKLIAYAVELMLLVYMMHVGHSQSVIYMFFACLTSAFGDFLPLYLLLGFLSTGWPFIPKNNGVYVPALARFEFNIGFVAFAIIFPFKFAESGNWFNGLSRIMDCLSSYILGNYLECTTKHLLGDGQFEGNATLIFRKVKMYRKLYFMVASHAFLNIPFSVFEYAATGYPWMGVLAVELRMLLVYISVVCIFWPLVQNQILLTIDDKDEKFAAEALKDLETYDLVNMRSHVFNIAAILILILGLAIIVIMIISNS